MVRQRRHDAEANVNAPREYCGIAPALRSRRLPSLRGRGWGRIVNISAGSAYLRNHSIYSLAKNGLIFLTEQLALELGPEINVNGVAPGQIVESAEDIAPYDPTFVERAIEYTPAGRLVTRAEIAELGGPAVRPGLRHGHRRDHAG
jgi:NAD(P)-dependent dehydrogenase (short-subunit alcohol dehydrogenase family)